MPENICPVSLLPRNLKKKYRDHDDARRKEARVGTRAEPKRGKRMRLKHEPKADQRDVERREIRPSAKLHPSLRRICASRCKMTPYNLPNDNPVTRQKIDAL